MNQKREQMWWAAACVVGLLVAAWAAGGFIGPLMAVFIVLFLAGAVLVEFDGRETPSGSGAIESDEDLRADAAPAEEQAAEEQAAEEQALAEPDVALAPDVETAESEADLREAVSSLA